jgi:hypothetical protein
MKLDSLVESGAKELGPRFSLVGVLPTVMLFLFVLALYWSNAPEHEPDLRAVVEKVEQIGGKEGVMLALGILLFALLLQPLQLSLVRLLEGYWHLPLLPSVGALLSWPGIAWHRKRRSQLKAQTQLPIKLKDATPTDKAGMAAADWRLRRYYPAPDRLLPTALGNVLRAAEDVPYQRYRLDAVVIWPRLYPLLPQNMIGILTDRRNQLDLAARFCAIFLLCAIISLFFLYRHGWWLLVPVLMLLLARLSYRGAVAAAVAYGESVQSAFDLYRFELYKALRMPTPSNLQAEKKTNQLITGFLRQGIDDELELLLYDKASPKN